MMIQIQDILLLQFDHLEKLSQKLWNIQDLRHNNILGESALVLATFLPQSALNNSRFFTQGVLQENYDSENMNYYVLTFAMWDMDTLIKIIERGLMGIVKKFKLEKKLNHQRRNTNLNFSNLPTDSSKDKDRKPIEIIAKILTSPPTNEFLLKNHEVFVQKFLYILQILVENMPTLIENNQEELWIRIYEVYTLLKICYKSQVTAGISESSTIIENNEKENSTFADTFEKELQWFYKKFNANELTPNFVTRFITLAKYHFDCNQQKESSCESVVNFCNHILSFVTEASEISTEIRSKINALRKSALDAFPFSKKEPELAVIQEEEEEEEEEVEEQHSQQQQQHHQSLQHQCFEEAMEVE